MPATTYGARLGAAALVGLLPALAVVVSLGVMTSLGARAQAADSVPVTLLLSGAALVAVPIWAGAAIATFVTGELLALFGEPTVRRVHRWALLPGAASACIALDNVHPWSRTSAAVAALACLVAWQFLLWLWWLTARRLARRNEVAGPRPISP